MTTSEILRLDSWSFGLLALFGLGTFRMGRVPILAFGNLMFVPSPMGLVKLGLGKLGQDFLGQALDWAVRSMVPHVLQYHVSNSSLLRDAGFRLSIFFL